MSAGKEVTVHEKAINAYGFSGFGYTIIDPETGVGGYLIEGKGSGSFICFLIGMVLGLMITILVASVFLPSGGLTSLILGSMLIGFGISLHALALSYALLFKVIDWGCFVTGLKIGLSPLWALGMGSIAPFTVKTILTIIGFGKYVSDVYNTASGYAGCNRP